MSKKEMTQPKKIRLPKGEVMNFFKGIKQKFKGYGIILVTIIMLIIFAPLAIKLMGWGLQTLNPTYLQKRAVADFNNSKDAYSTIEGTKVAKVPLNGIEKIFSFNTISNKEVIISIPKVLNTSSIFNDDTDKSRKFLKNAWISSLDTDKLSEEVKKFEFRYNGSLISSKGEKGNIIVNEDVNNLDRKVIQEKLEILIDNETTYEFQMWDVTHKKENVYFEENGNTISVNGYFVAKNIIPNWVPKFGKPVYRVVAKFQSKDNKIEYIPKSLKVSKK